MSLSIEKVLYSDFPEELWPPSSADKKEYKDRLIRGAEIALSSKVCITGLARNISAALEKTIPRIERICSMFERATVIIYENDSKDDTLKKLNRWAMGNADVFIETESLGHKEHKQDRSLSRMEAMSYYRNVLLNYARQNHTDFIINLDMDLVGGYSYKGILNSLSYNGTFDVIGSNSIIYDLYEGRIRRLYYDSWAFRKDQWEPHMDEEINPLQFHRGEPLVKVNSCFGGLAIYRRKSLLHKDIKYSGPSCEHVELHKRMTDVGFGRIFLNPSMICLYSEF